LTLAHPVRHNRGVRNILASSLLLAGLVASVANAADTNVASAANGAKAMADSEFSGSQFDKDGVAPASRLIDGVIGKEPVSGEVNRWHSALAKPHPHWACIKFAGPARIHKVVLWHSLIGSPVDVEGQWSPDNGKTVKRLFALKGLKLDEEHHSVEVEFKPVTTDNFRLVITRSSNRESPNYTQLSELQVFGEWDGPRRPEATTPKPTIGAMVDAPLPEGLTCEQKDGEIRFTSAWMKIAFPLNRPGISYLSLDGLGLGQLDRNFLKAPRGFDFQVTGWDSVVDSSNATFTVSRTGNVVRYSGIGAEGAICQDLTFTVGAKSIQVSVDRPNPRALQGSPLRALFDVRAAAATPLGRLKSKGELRFPVLLHFADHGSFLVRESGGATWNFTGNRGAGEVELALRLPAGAKHVSLDMQMTAIYPEKAIVDADPKLAGIKKAWLNTFGYRPDTACLSNNVVSDNCLFVLYQYADHAFLTPPLFKGFTALDMVRTTLDADFDGTTAYGDDRDVWLDSDPSLVISSWDYVVGKRDIAWLKRRIKDIELYADHIVACDKDGDGLSESKRTGISGSGIDGAGEWSSNWWDVVSFGWKDAYVNALDYRAFRCMVDLEKRLGRKDKADFYAKRAAMIKKVYYSTFYNPETGVLAGWRSKDGKLHDYYFTFVNGIAVCYGLVDRAQGNAIMDSLLAKMKEVGYTNFRIGLPGNLVPVHLNDYAGGGTLGQPHVADGSDSFQNYENGGATAGFSYFTVQALYTLGRKDDAERIFGGLLEGFRDGVFQGGIGSGVDWKRWDGTPCGYEGLLVDSYYALGAFITGRLGKGVRIP
jgi:hypothetical protein